MKMRQKQKAGRVEQRIRLAEAVLRRVRDDRNSVRAGLTRALAQASQAVRRLHDAQRELDEMRPVFAECRLILQALDRMAPEGAFYNRPSVMPQHPQPGADFFESSPQVELPPYPERGPFTASSAAILRERVHLLDSYAVEKRYNRSLHFHVKLKGGHVAYGIGEHALASEPLELVVGRIAHELAARLVQDIRAGRVERG